VTRRPGSPPGATRRPARAAGRELVRIEGRRPVEEALRSGRRIRRILVAEGAEARGTLATILAAAAAAGVSVERVPRAALDRTAETRAHQGVVAEAEPFRYRSWREALRRAERRGEPPLLLALDGVEDPGNVGALLRSAEAAGCHGVILRARRAAPVTPAAEKASAGAVEHLVVDRVPNLARALAECRRAGLWVVGLDASAAEPLFGCALLREPVVLVVGSEARGLSRLVAERADLLVRIPMAGRVASLSAPAAGTVALFEARRLRDMPDMPASGPERR
jgi:23S rRNA (guanosine2251-2'-O)-methyltransferase